MSRYTFHKEGALFQDMQLQDRNKGSGVPSIADAHADAAKHGITVDLTAGAPVQAAGAPVQAAGAPVQAESVPALVASAPAQVAGAARGDPATTPANGAGASTQAAAAGTGQAEETPKPKGSKGKRKAGAADVDDTSSQVSVDKKTKTPLMSAFQNAKVTITTLSTAKANYTSLMATIKTDDNYEWARSDFTFKKLTSAYQALEKVETAFSREFSLNQNLNVLRKNYNNDLKLELELKEIPEAEIR